MMLSVRSKPIKRGIKIDAELVVYLFTALYFHNLRLKFD